ncbi:MAG: D-alanyl-D-alanine carboxypeptidase [Firmicutes bacterium]|nr:D-alanyl-D-alanine carboxypeptidase [Bacillota bacterium]
MGKKLIIGLILSTLLTLTSSFPAAAFTINARAAVLMDPASGQVLYAQDGSRRLAPASVTKVMTMLLIMEAVEEGRIKWDDPITTSATAAGMGGSQVYLKEGEVMTLHDMFKAVAVVSANDASTAIAEHLYGSVTDFIDAMNRKAKALGLKNTHFANETGLPDSGHYSSAYDLAVISRELLKYPKVLEYTSIWLDSLRGGAFILKNTNDLIKAYPGTDGLKTGHTEEAKFCLAATHHRGNFRLLSVVMGAASNSSRVAESKRLLEYGYRTYERRIIKKAGSKAGEIYLKEGSPQTFPVKVKTDFAIVVLRGGKQQLISTRVVPLKNLKFPINAGQRVGEVQAVTGGKIVGRTSVYSMVKVKRANFLVRWWRGFRDFLSGIFGRRRHSQGGLTEKTPIFL